MDPLAAAGRCFRHERNARGLTAAAVASTVGCSPQYLCDIEKGRRVPSPEMAWRLLSAIDAGLVIRSRIANGWMHNLLCELDEWAKVRRG